MAQDAPYSLLSGNVFICNRAIAASDSAETSDETEAKEDAAKHRIDLIVSITA